MSFVLPGNARSLRFTGEVKALTKPESPNGGTGLGKPRVRKPPPPRRVSGAPAPPAISIPTPTRGGEGRIVTPYPSIQYESFVELASAHDSEDNPTMAMDRDALDVLPGGAIRTPKRTFAAGASAIPNFRPTGMMVEGVERGRLGPRPPTATVSPSRGAPLAVWLFAAILAAIVSYHIAPELLLQSPARVSQQP